MINIAKPRKVCREDIECQCMALAHAAHIIEDVDIRELLLFTLTEKHYQLAIGDYIMDTAEVPI
ncbi:hypothetical protein [Sodalis sp. RH19]|uniref:hypothetical protein n=1 Tax=Sodalis sp. RH19 TaxID=3394334 RepID=UPI0039B5F128